jgi:diguanylate cyclase (GGDEF)-like protein
MIDIDYFKQYNDFYGHIGGDDCLKRVVAALKFGATRPRDFLARYGGEEFALVLPETDEQGAESVAMRCRQALDAEGIPHVASPISDIVTVSIGVATIVPTADDDRLAFIDCVDRNLYRAKQGGRNSLVAGRRRAS